MPLRIIRQDITKMECDAIVNATNSALIPGGGSDAAMHKAAGPRLAEACRKLGSCPTGQARLTRGYALSCKYVIHTVGPIWQGGGQGEQEALEECYRSCLALAKKKRCQSVAFPLIAAGAFGYPKERALKVAVDCIGTFLLENDMTVWLVLFGERDYAAGSKLFPEIQSYIDETYVEAHKIANDRSRSVYPGYLPDGLPASLEHISFQSAAPSPEEMAPFQATLRSDAAPAAGRKKASASLLPAAERKRSARRSSAPVQMAAQAAAAPTAASLADALRQLDESFSQMLLRKIDESGMTDAQCYKKANIDRKLFSKIRSDAQYKPSKTTALAFAIALELPLPETNDMLRKAGFALSHSNKFDIIIEYFIRNGNYNIFEINEALFAFDQSLLGG